MSAYNASLSCIHVAHYEFLGKDGGSGHAWKCKWRVMREVRHLQGKLAEVFKG